MNGILTWLLYVLPWYVQAGMLLALYCGGLWLASTIFGWKRVRPFALPLLGLAAVLTFAVKLRQDGYSDRKAEEDKAVDVAVDDFKRHEDAVDKKPIDQIDKENEPWLRP